LALLSANTSRTEALINRTMDHFPTEYDERGGLTGGVWETSWGKNGQPSALSGYDLTTGQVTESFCTSWLAPQLNDDTRICITQEFGTRSKVVVGNSVIDENYAHFYGTDVEKKVYGSRVRDSFYVQTSKWKKSVLKRGLKVYFQALAYLNRKRLEV
jgi:hypothetical protein